MLKVSSNKQCLIDFHKHFGTPISRGAIRKKIIKKWNKALVIEDQIRGRAGQPKDAQTNENIAMLS